MPDIDLNEMFDIPAPIVWDDLQMQAIEACCDVKQTHRGCHWQGRHWQDPTDIVR